MRHVWSLLAGLLVAPLIACVLSIRFNPQVWERAQDLNVVLIIAAGLLIGVLASLRWSPVGPIVAGLILVTPNLLFTAFRVGVPWASLHRSLGEGVEFRAGFGAMSLTALAGGCALLVAAASPSRWKAWPRPVAPATLSVDPVVDTGRIDAVAAWRPFPDDTSEATLPLGIPAEQRPSPSSELPATGPWAPPPTQR